MFTVREMHNPNGVAPKEHMYLVPDRRLVPNVPNTTQKMFTVYGMMYHLFHSVQDSGDTKDEEMDAEMIRMADILPFRLLNYDASLNNSHDIAYRIIDWSNDSILFDALHIPSRRSFVFRTYNDNSDTLTLVETKRNAKRPC